MADAPLTDDLQYQSYGLTQSDSNNTFLSTTFHPTATYKSVWPKDTDDNDIIDLQTGNNSDSFSEELKKLDKFQSYFSGWTLISEQHFRN